MEPARESSNFKGKAVTSAVDESKDESLGYPRCSKPFTTVNGLYGHENDHRFVKEASYMSPVSVAVVNNVNPPPPNYRPDLNIPRGRMMIPVTKEPDDVVPKQPPITRTRTTTQHQRNHRYPNEKDGNSKLILQDNSIVMGSINNDKKKRKTRTTRKKKAEGESSKGPGRQRRQKRQSIDLNNMPQGYVETPQAQVAHYQYQSEDRVTADLLREWTPMTAGFGNEISYSGAGAGAGRSRTSSGPVDLELRLGLGNY